MDNLDIIDRCKEGDSIAWERFIAAYGPLAQQIVRRYFSLPLEDIENITQNVFIKLYDGGIAQFRGTTVYELRAYYKIIVLNETKTYLQKENRWRDKIEDFSFVSDETGSDDYLTGIPGDNIENRYPIPDRFAEGKEAARIVDQILGKYPLRERQIFFLKLKGYKEKEISEMTGIPMGSIASSYSRMIDKIQEALKRNGLDSL